MSNAISEYNQTEAALSLLSEKYAGATYEVNTTAGMQLAKAGRAEIRGYRTALEAKRKELKAPALERSRLIDAEAKRITAELVLLEDAIYAQIQAEEERKEAVKKAKAEATETKAAAPKAAAEKKPAAAKAAPKAKSSKTDADKA